MGYNSLLEFLEENVFNELGFFFRIQNNCFIFFKPWGSYYFFFSAGDQIQGFIKAKQVLYHWAAFPAL